MQEKGSQEQLGSSVDLESSIDDAVSLKAVKISRGSESNLSGSELEASSTEDILSSKDSLNSIPSVRVKSVAVLLSFKHHFHALFFNAE